MRRAFAVSLGIHMAVAFIIPLWPAQLSSGPEAVETLSFAHIAHIRIEKHADPRPLPVAMPKTKRRSSVVSFERKRSELTTNRYSSHSRPIDVNGPQGRVAAAPRDVPKDRPVPLLARAPGLQPAKAQTLQPAPGPSPNPQGTSDIAMSGSGANDRGGVSPFGAEQPPVLDPAVKTALQQRFNVHVVLIVTVGEDGKTKKIEFRPPLDDATQRQIQTLLANATWDAAVCGGGVSCEGVATIKL
ncbi:MAG TPA: hypothetical protein VFW34_04305 [Candidatus Rubrimentiphilum sp.]|nr:hypothetical protein [Candidatus Rubrimentiphilum sp.]